MKDILLNFIQFVFDIYDACIEWSLTMLTYNLDDKHLSAGTSMADKLNTDAMTPIAIQIVGICFLISFLKILNKDDIIRIETYAKIFFMMCFSKSAVNYSFKLCRLIYNTGSGIILNAKKTFYKASTVNTFEINESTIKEALKEMGVLEILLVSVICIVFLLFIVFCSLLITIISWGRYVEILVLMCGCSLPMGFLPLQHEGGHVIKNYFKYFSAVVLQGFVIAVTLMICQKLLTNMVVDLASDSSLGSVVAILGNILINCVVMLVTIMKSTQIAQKWVGQ